MRKKEEAKRQIAMEEHMEKLNAQRRHLKRLREIDEKSEGYVIEQRPAKRIKLNVRLATRLASAISYNITLTIANFCKLTYNRQNKQS